MALLMNQDFLINADAITISQFQLSLLNTRQKPLSMKVNPAFPAVNLALSKSGTYYSTWTAPDADADSI